MLLTKSFDRNVSNEYASNHVGLVRTRVQDILITLDREIFMYIYLLIQEI